MQKYFWTLLILLAANSYGQKKVSAPGVNVVHIQWKGSAVKDSALSDRAICEYKVVYDTSYNTHELCYPITQKITYDTTYIKCFLFWCRPVTKKVIRDTTINVCSTFVDTIIIDYEIPIYCDTVPIIEKERSQGSGINLIWSPESGDNLPDVKSIQGIYRWKEIQPTPNTYDWRRLHSDLARAKQLGKPIMMQLNQPAPDWIKNHVAVVGISRGGYAYQFWDTTYMRFHLTVLQRFAEEIAIDPNKDMVIGVRVQPNGYNTEYITYEATEFESPIPDENNKATWISQPPGYSVLNPKYKPNRTDIYPETNQQYYQHYMKVVNNSYINNFHTQEVNTAWRTLLLNRDFPPEYADSLFALPFAMALDTRCGWNLSDGTKNRYALLRKRCRDGNAIGYWEDSQYEWTGHTWQQNMYWRNMLRLDAGISYPAVYGAHMEYDSSFAFTNKYAGYYNLPKITPGAWIIFCRNRVVENNMGYFITLTNPQDVTYIEDFNLKAKEGAFAMKINSEKSINLNLDNAFYETVKNQNVQVSITYYSQPGISFQLIGQSIVTGDNTNSYKTVNYLIPASQTLNLQAITGNPVIHKIEIEKTTY